MKRIFGIFLCMGVFIAGAAFGSPPGTTDTEITAVTDIGSGMGEITVALRNVELNYSEAPAPVAFGISGHFAEAIAVSDRVVIPAPAGEKWRHRWRVDSNDYRTPVNMIYRPAWKRKVCEG